MARAGHTTQPVKKKACRRRRISTNASNERIQDSWKDFVVADKANGAVAEPAVETITPVKEQQKQKTDKKPRRQPRYNVILWDDNDHSYDYVIIMMRKLFGHAIERGMQIALEVDKSGRAICLTTTMEHAELKRDQIHSFGKDILISRCKGSMSATIEPVPSE